MSERRQVLDDAILAVQALSSFGQQTTAQERRGGAKWIPADYLDGFNTALDMAVAAIEVIQGCRAMNRRRRLYDR